MIKESDIEERISELEKENRRLSRENECLLSKNNLLTAFLVERSLAIEYIQWKSDGDECELFSLHKPSDIRCLIEILNELNRQNVEIIKYGDSKFNVSEIVDLLNEMNEDIQYLNAFLVEQGLAEEYIRWKGDD